MSELYNSSEQEASVDGNELRFQLKVWVTLTKTSQLPAARTQNSIKTVKETNTMVFFVPLKGLTLESFIFKHVDAAMDKRGDRLDGEMAGKVQPYKKSFKTKKASVFDAAKHPSWPTAMKKKQILKRNLFRARVAPKAQTSPTDRSTLNGLINELKTLSVMCWAEVEASELKRRQESIPAVLKKFAAILKRGTGAELQMEGIWSSSSGLQAHSASSHMMQGFAETDGADQVRGLVYNFAAKHIGQALHTNIKRAVIAVYGDPNLDFRPVLPNCDQHQQWEILRELLRRFLEFLWVSVRNPTLWDEIETKLWGYYVWNKGLDDPRVFQFCQVRPNQLDLQTRTTKHPNSMLRYPPQSLAYFCRVQLSQAEPPRMPAEWTGLPPKPDPPVTLLSKEEHDAAKKIVAGKEELMMLLQFVNQYERLGPFQGDPDNWSSFAQGCKLLPKIAPDPDAGIEAFYAYIDNNGAHLPVEFFDTTHPQHTFHNLDACMRWLEGAQCIHPATGTYYGGPWGLKWIVLLFVFLIHCGSKVKDGQGPNYGAEVDVEWRANQERWLLATAERVREKLYDSAQKLGDVRNALEPTEASSNNGSSDGGDAGSWSIDSIELINPEEDEEAAVDEWTAGNIPVTDGIQRGRPNKAKGKGKAVKKKSAASRKRTHSTDGDASDEAVFTEDNVNQDAAGLSSPPRKKSKSKSASSDAEEISMPASLYSPIRTRNFTRQRAVNFKEPLPTRYSSNGEENEEEPEEQEEEENGSESTQARNTDKQLKELLSKYTTYNAHPTSVEVVPQLQKFLKWPPSGMNNNTLTPEKNHDNIRTILQMTIDEISRVFRVNLYACGAWPDEHGNTVSTSTFALVSGNAKTLVDSLSPEGHWADAARKATGVFWATNPSTAFGVTHPDMSYNAHPSIPPVHPVWTQERENIYENLCFKYNWQGGVGEPPWDQLAADVKSETYELVHKARFDPKLTVMHPLAWHEQQTRFWLTHLRRFTDEFRRSKQSNPNYLKHEFQWKRLSDENGEVLYEDVAFREEQRPGVNVKYSRVALEYWYRLHKTKTPVAPAKGKPKAPSLTRTAQLMYPDDMKE
ncbi:hypothetical protein FRC07_005098, partial [Ceratobasidium sp. 392]